MLVSLMCTPRVSLRVSALLINWLFRHQIDRPEDQCSDQRFDNDVGQDHLLQALCPQDTGKGDDGKKQAVHGNGDGIGGEDPRPLRPLFSAAPCPVVIDLRVNQLSDKRREDGRQYDPHLQGEEKLPGNLPSAIRPIRLGRQQYHQLKIESCEQVDSCRQPDGGDCRLLAELLMDQVAPGESKGVDEAGIHDQAAEVSDLGGGYVACQGEEEIKARENYGGLSFVDP